MAESLESCPQNSKECSILSRTLRYVEKMSKNASIEANLSEALDDFLRYLNVDNDDPNGCFSTNFGKAGLLLEQSGALYGKKVDMLWDIIIDCQKRFVERTMDDSGDREVELRKLEERKRKSKRKRKVNSDEQQNKSLLNNYSYNCNNNVNYLTKVFDGCDLLDNFNHAQVEESGNEFEGTSHNPTFLPLPDTTVWSEDKDYIGRFEQIHSATIVQELINLNQHNLIEGQDCISSIQIETEVISDFMHMKQISSNKPSDFYMDDLNNYIGSFRERLQLKKRSDSMMCREVSVESERLPSTQLSEKDRRSSMYSAADSMFDNTFDDGLSTVSEHLHECCTPASEQRSKSCSQDSAFCESMDEGVERDFDSTPSVFATPIPPTLNDSSDLLVDDMADTVNDSSEVLADDIADADESDKENVDVNGETPRNDDDQDDRRCLVGAAAIVIPKMQKERRIKEKVEKEKKVVNESPPRKRRLTAKMLAVLSTGCVPTSCEVDFERFFRIHYKPADNEGIPPPFLEPQDANEPDSDMDNEDNTLPTLPEVDEPNDPMEVDEQNDPMEDEAQALPSFTQPFVSSIQDITKPSDRIRKENRELCDSFTDIRCEEESRKAVKAWRHFIQPILQNMEKKADFDIHQYGSEILNGAEVGETVKFGKIVEDKGGAEVARYFNAVLQLANSRNVEIGGVVPGRLANETLELKIADKSRHHETLDDYQAPSEECFKARLEKVRTMNPLKRLHSTPYSECVDKRGRVGESSSARRLFQIYDEDWSD